MTHEERIIQRIPPEYQEKVLEWMEHGRPITLANPSYSNLYEAYFIYVDPEAVRKDRCQVCLQNVYDNWRSLLPAIRKAIADRQIFNLL